MRSWSGALCGVVLTAQIAGAVCATPDAPPAPRPLRLVTLNVLHGGMSSGLWGDGDRLEQRLAVTTDALRALDADVIGLQEASQAWGRGDVTGRIADALGYQSTFAGATSRLFGGGLLGFLSAAVLDFDEGPAIVSRFPITGTTTRLLAQCGAFYRRVLVCAEVCTPWGAVEACSTHLNGSACQARSVQQALAGHPPMPVILMGDLNAGEDDASLHVLRDDAGFVDTFRTANPTLTGFTDDQDLDVDRATVELRADYVLVAPAGGHPTRVVESHVVLDHPFHSVDGDLLWPSDHYGVLSEVDLFGRTSPPLRPPRRRLPARRRASARGSGARVGG
jgi:endonuclease/exonuclease/phosphatase family metal-dependent hydrolase